MKLSHEETEAKFQSIQQSLLSNQVTSTMFLRIERGLY